MTRQSLPLDDQLYQYLLTVGVREHPVLKALREETGLHRLAKMQISPEQGQFLGWLCRLHGVKKYLEIGVFTGYSSLVMALNMPDDGQIEACDGNETFTKVAKRYWSEACVDHRINLRLKLAVDALNELEEEGHGESFDMAFIDADKPTYPAYLEYCYRLVRKGGIIIVDNVFYSGKVANPQAGDSLGVRVVNQFNRDLQSDQRFDLCVLPVGDGLTLLIKR